jgi:ribosome-associated translation inhibitor RaiA
MKTLVLTLALAATLVAGAQTKDTLRLNVNGNEIIILTDDVNNLSQTDFNAIIQRLTAETQRIMAEYNAEVDEINRKQTAGTITAEQATEQREAATENMQDAIEALSDEIENWADRYGEQLEENAEDPTAWKAQWEANAEKYEAQDPPTPPNAPAPPAPKKGTTVVINDDGVTIESDEDWDPDKVKDAREKYKANQTIGYFEWYFGWNNWFNENGMATDLGTPQTTELDFWPSMVWGFGFGGRTRFGSSQINVRYGTQFNWHFYVFRGNNVIVKDEVIDGITIMPDPTRNYQKSSLRSVFWDFPVLLEWDASKPGKSNGFSLAAGGYGGLRMGTRNRQQFSDFNNDRTEVRIFNNYYTNQWRYGLMAQVGLGTFKITAKYDLNNLFRQDKVTPDYQVGSLTLGWVFP